ncbi:MAG: HAMP domain-containing sensor histidine kinase [Cyclobacteriaceae bacterium]
MKNRVRDVLLRRSALIITLTLILGAVSLLRIVSTHKDVEDVAEIDLPLIEALTQIETNQLEQSINFERAIRYAQEMEMLEMEREIQEARQNFILADSAFRYLAKTVDQDLLSAENQVSDALKRTAQETQQAKLKNLHFAIKKLESDHSSYENHALVVLGLLEEGNMDQALLLMDRVEEEEDQFNKQVEGVLMRHEMFTETLVRMVEQEEVLSMKWVVTLTLIFVILSLGAVYLFSYKIWRPLEDIRSGAQRLGQGKFDDKVRLRSNSITEDVVDSFNTMAEQLKQSKKDIDKFINFSYQSSHDLKAPIKNIQSLLEMLEKEKTGSSNYETILNNTKRSAKKLETTVLALTQFNQVREQLGTNKEMLDIEQVFKEVASSLIEQIKEANPSIRKDFSDCPQIFYPKSHLKSILYHLLSNALKYRNPDKKLLIEIKSSRSNNHPVLMIRDNGLGFDSIRHGDEAMKPFVRLHAHTEGTGLGLHIVKTIVDYHKGSVRIDSEEKKGAKFTLWLN